MEHRKQVGAQLDASDHCDQTVIDQRSLLVVIKSNLERFDEGEELVALELRALLQLIHVAQPRLGARPLLRRSVCRHTQMLLDSVAIRAYIRVVSIITKFR